ncbi:MAG: hypothetical protein Q8Q23_01125 [bacterium]|nr:hypothetical protein [bacterium]
MNNSLVLKKGLDYSIEEFLQIINQHTDKVVQMPHVGNLRVSDLYLLRQGVSAVYFDRNQGRHLYDERVIGDYVFRPESVLTNGHWHVCSPTKPYTLAAALPVTSYPSTLARCDALFSSNPTTIHLRSLHSLFNGSTQTVSQLFLSEYYLADGWLKSFIRADDVNLFDRRIDDGAVLPIFDYISQRISLGTGIEGFWEVTQKLVRLETELKENTSLGRGYLLNAVIFNTLEIALLAAQRQTDTLFVCCDDQVSYMLEKKKYKLAQRVYQLLRQNCSVLPDQLKVVFVPAGLLQQHITVSGCPHTGPISQYDLINYPGIRLQLQEECLPLTFRELKEQQ